MTLLPLVSISLRLISETIEASHWRKTYQRRKHQRTTTYQYLAWTLGHAPPLPLTVTLTRVAPRALDSGNLESSFKAVQDGVADWIDSKPFIRKGVGGGQDRQAGLVWQYRQRRGAPRVYAVEILIETGAE